MKKKWKKFKTVCGKFFEFSSFWFAKIALKNSKSYLYLSETSFLRLELSLNKLLQLLTILLISSKLDQK